MRIAVNAEQLLYSSPGGIGRYTAQLLTGIATNSTDQVVPFVARHSREEITAAFGAAGVPAPASDAAIAMNLPRPVLYEGWLTGRGWPRLRALGSLDVVHAPSVAVPPLSKSALVVTVHDAAPELFPDAFPRAGRRFHRRGLAAAARRADLVIAVSESAADDIAGHGAIDRRRIRVVPNGIDPPTEDVGESAAVVEAKGLSGRPYVLWVGSLEPRKGVGTLISAMALIAQRRADLEVQTVLAGYGGWMGEGLISPSDRAVLGSSLHELGRVSESELWGLYRGASVFAFPSRYEGFGLPVLEAMSQGVPVVASDIAALREVTDGAATLIEPLDVNAWAEAISALVEDGSVAAVSGEAGRLRSKAYPLEAMLERTRAVYSEAAAR